MPDTGKLKRLFERCTSNFFATMGSHDTMDYPEGDLDGIAEQILLYVDKLELHNEEQQLVTMQSERRLAFVMGQVRMAEKNIKGAITGSEERRPKPATPIIDDGDEDSEYGAHPMKRKKPMKKRPLL